MNHSEGTFEGYNGLNLYYQSWQPDEQIRAVVVMVHGLGGHSSLFNPVVEYLVAKNFEVYAFDLRGHGRSPGQRGHIDTWMEFREDLRAFLQHVRDPRSQCPCFLWGHSLGGTIVLDYAVHLPTTASNALQGVIVTAPALGKVGVSASKLVLGRLLSRVMPRFSLKLGFQSELCTRAPAVCAAYLQDPLRHEYGSARLATEFFAAVDNIYKQAVVLQTPLLLLHGSEDQITLPEASRSFFQQVPLTDKELREYSNSAHDLYIDLDHQSVLLDLHQWIDRHLEENAACRLLIA